MQISKDALILTIVVTNFRRNGVGIFREYWQLGRRQKEAFVTRTICRVGGVQIHTCRNGKPFSISREPGVGGHFRPECVGGLSYTRRRVLISAKGMFISGQALSEGNSMGGNPPGPIGRTNNPLIDSGTMCRNESSLPGPMCNQRQAAHRDEITPIACYIVVEMNTNAHGADVKRMAEMNSFSAEACIADFSKLPLWKQILGLGIQPDQCVDMQLSYRTAALIAWGIKVKQNGDWDHKPKIAARFHPRSPGGLQHWHLYGNTLYYYEVWSNLHYGYVGRTAGFSESVLLDGAGLEQIGSTMLRLKLPEKSPAVAGLRAWDDPHDRAAIMMGIHLYRQKHKLVTVQDVMNLVLLSNSILKKPYSS
jgi:putative RNase toxin 44 of polymorphic toxin system